MTPCLMKRKGGEDAERDCCLSRQQDEVNSLRVVRCSGRYWDVFWMKGGRGGWLGQQGPPPASLPPTEPDMNDK